MQVAFDLSPNTLKTEISTLYTYHVTIFVLSINLSRNGTNSALTTNLNSYASTTALTTTDSKFYNCITTTDLQTNYAQKTDIPVAVDL